MSWEKTLKTELAKCKVAMCSARDCVWNERGQCSREYISIGANGDCSNYKLPTETNK
tara:strand:- start:315 stop:485 length:171 start_codon:yes stop_codon:yes gene_type:complete